MVLPAGESEISFSGIRTEFGTEGNNGNGPIRLGQYRSGDPSFTNKNIGELTNLPLDDGIQTSVAVGSSAINIDSFHSKKLNTVVDLHETGNTTYNHNARTDRFQASMYDIVGGYRSVLQENNDAALGWQGGKKIIFHINNTFSSTGATNQTDVALTVGDGWPANTTYAVDLGDSAVVAGKGGDGGDGGNGTDGGTSADGKEGGTGTSALALETGMTYTAAGGAQIVGGGGGGGGGAGASQDDTFMGIGDTNEAGGGGGGGGAGVPAGAAGAGGSGGGATGGSSGNVTGGGGGGEGGSSGSPPEAIGTDGGDGGGPGSAGENGATTGGRNTTGDAADGGTAGSNIIYF